MNQEEANIRAAVEMVELFASVGAERFELTHTNLDQEPRGCRHSQSVDQIKTSLPYLIPSSFRRQNNVILRPHNSARAAFIQLDDLKAEDVERVKPAAFMVIETSPANFQAWLAVEGYFCPTHRKGKIGRFHSCGLSSSPSLMERRQKSSSW